MAEIHKCGQGWAYCDGNCASCAVNNCYTATGTNTVKDYPPYLDYPKERKKQTNADKIRQMTDDELAEFLAQRHFYDKLWCKRWLEQEADNA